MTDPSPEGCEVCGEAPVTKVLYPAAIHFKGSGFYSTDYGRGNRRGTQKESADGGGGDGGEKKKSDKTEKTDKTQPKAAEA
jgi:predicted nucleic acid-binding Zn ribbon protein